MKKSEVEQILLIVKVGAEIALNMKVYKEGTLCRQGAGGIPSIGISAMSHTGSNIVFNQLMEKVTDDMLAKPQGYTDEQINRPLEYILGFYGVSSNEEKGEGAQWTKSTGIRFELDFDTSFRHPLLSFVDRFSIEATALTNSWYFDVMIHSMFNLKSSAMPEATMIALPPKKEEITRSFNDYMSHILQLNKSGDLSEFTTGKLYTGEDGKTVRVKLNRNAEQYQFSFEPLDGEGPAAPPEEKKNRWKFW